MGYDDYAKYWKSWTLSRVMEQTLLKNSFMYFKCTCINTKCRLCEESHYGYDVFNVSDVDVLNRQLMIYPPGYIPRRQSKTVQEYELWYRNKLLTLKVYEDTFPVLEEFKVILSFKDPPCPSYNHPHFTLKSIDLDIFWNIMDVSNTIEKIIHNIEEKIFSDHPREYCKSDKTPETDDGIPTIKDMFGYADCARADVHIEWNNLKSHIRTLFNTMLNA